MPYIGNPPAERFTSFAYQDLTGGSGTSFTLNNAVGNPQEIEVFVNNVRQEPGVAYTVSGTALTMTGSIATTDDFYVVFQGKAIQTATHPSDRALTATDGTFTNGLTVDDDGATPLTVDRATSDGAVVDVQKDGSSVGVIGVVNSDLYIADNESCGIRFTGSELRPVTHTGANADNTIDLGDGSVRYKDLYLGGGAYIGGTGAANQLDDYEEGLFTPSFTSDGTNPTVSYSFQRGFYTKVGRTVYFQIQLGTDSVSVGSGSLFVSGLPFTSNSSLQSRAGAIGLHYTWGTGIPDAKWVLFANDNKLYLYPGDNVGNTMPTSYLDTGSSKNRIWIQGFYDV